ncbi:hypothetical protein Axi01nite_71850 [Actinoplanes xinjiangensis]|nr:hypothetical protein Axi01nite_71850 [Actinoplanes xinjiangensis]
MGFPLTSTSAGRLAEPPLAYLKPMVAVPAVAAVTENCTAAPAALLALQNPLPEKPAWLDSMAPSQVAGALSDSNRLAAAEAVVEMIPAAAIGIAAAAASSATRLRRLGMSVLQT